MQDRLLHLLVVSFVVSACAEGQRAGRPDSGGPPRDATFDRVTADREGISDAELDTRDSTPDVWTDTNSDARLDSNVPDISVPDISVPDVSVPDSTASDSGVADAIVADWRADCDCDGYADNGAVTSAGTRPAVAPASCGPLPSSCNGRSAWTDRQPTGSDRDCDDTRSDVNPGNQSGSTFERSSGNWDYDCDGTSEFTDFNLCTTTCASLSVGSCFSSTTCWLTTPSGCGQRAMVQSGCSWNGFSCESSGDEARVECH